MFEGQVSKELCLFGAVFFYLIAFQVNFFFPGFLWVCYVVALAFAVLGLNKLEIEKDRKSVV